jgi:hypothetical protein
MLWGCALIRLKYGLISGYFMPCKVEWFSQAYRSYCGMPCIVESVQLGIDIGSLFREFRACDLGRPGTYMRTTYHYITAVNAFNL